MTRIDTHDLAVQEPKCQVELLVIYTSKTISNHLDSQPGKTDLMVQEDFKAMILKTDMFFNWRWICR